MSLTTHEISAPPLMPFQTVEEYAHLQHPENFQGRGGLFVLMMSTDTKPERLSSGAVLYPNTEIYAEGMLLEGSTIESEPNLDGMHALWYGHSGSYEQGTATLVVPPMITVTGTWLAINNRRRVAGLGPLPGLGAGLTVQALARSLRGQQVNGAKVGLVIGEDLMMEPGTEQKTLVDVRSGRSGRMVIRSEDLVVKS